MSPIRISALFALVFALLSGGCASTPEDEIVGTWKEVGGTEVLQFLEDGEIIQENAGGSIGAAYRFVDDQNIRVDFGGPAVYAPPRSYRVQIQEDLLSLTDEKDSTKSYRRTERKPTIDTDPR